MPVRDFLTRLIEVGRSSLNVDDTIPLAGVLDQIRSVPLPLLYD